MNITVQHLSKTFGDFVALADVSLTIGTGELVALLGPSGSGKTTLLRIIAGLEVPDHGSVAFAGEDVTCRDARDRGVGFVFQHYALFRQMTVFENVAFGLRVKPRRQRPPESQLQAKVKELLTLVRLESLATRYPSQLSGGQCQRVALARALAVEPKILLLDEPFGALDAKVRQELRRWLRQLHEEIGITSVFVTHDQEEALELADRIVVMQAGKVEQIGTPEEIYEHPATPFVYQFLGHVNIFHGRVENGKMYLGELTMDINEGQEAAAGSAVAYARPHRLAVAPRPNGQPQFRAIVNHIHAAGPFVKVDLATETGRAIRVEMPQEQYRDLHIQPGAEVFVRVQELTVFPTSGRE
jgi:sulfate/thiosulfate transport system ATP-binding protein